MKTLLGITAIATLALALPASAAEHGKKPATHAKHAVMSTTTTAGTMAPASMPATAKEATVKKAKP